MTVKSPSMAAAVLMLTLAPAFAAGANRTFVSGNGSDSNPCTIAAPCRSLQAAVNVTAPAGEVVILTPGGYGTVTISQSITIANDGVGTASISVPSGGSGITINAGNSDNVQLRGLEIDGNNVGTDGVQSNTVGVLTILNCVIRHNQFGIVSQGGQIIINNSTFSDQYSYGILFYNSTAIVSNTLVSGNTNYGIVVSPNATAYVDHDTVTRNGFGLEALGNGTIYTLQTNNVHLNTQDTDGNVTAVTPN